MARGSKGTEPAAGRGRPGARSILAASILVLGIGAETGCDKAAHGTGSAPCRPPAAEAPGEADAPTVKHRKAFKVTEGEPPQYGKPPRPCVPATYGLEGAAEVEFKTYLSTIGGCRAVHTAAPGLSDGGIFMGDVPESVVLTSEKEFRDVFVNAKDPASCASQIDWTASNLAVLYFVKNSNKTLAVKWVAQDGGTITIGIATGTVCQGVAASSKLIALAVVIPAGADGVTAQACDVVLPSCGQIP